MKMFSHGVWLSRVFIYVICVSLISEIGGVRHANARTSNPTHQRRVIRDILARIVISKNFIQSPPQVSDILKQPGAALNYTSSVIKTELSKIGEITKVSANCKAVKWEDESIS